MSSDTGLYEGKERAYPHTESSMNSIGSILQATILSQTDSPIALTKANNILFVRRLLGMT